MIDADLWLWAILPYVAMVIFVVGHVWRWRYDRFGWDCYSTQLLERRLLKWGGPIFHYGALAAIAGHVIGILIPASATRALGVPENVYRWFSAIPGAIAAILVVLGIALLAGRRMLVPRVRATTAKIDYVALILLLIIVLTGVLPTFRWNLLGPGYDYRLTVSPWFRGLFTGNPPIDVMKNAPVMYQLHAAASWAIWAVWPFSRLVHAWSFPLWYLWRPYVVYRSRRNLLPPEPGTSGRRWRKIGAPQ